MDPSAAEELHSTVVAVVEATPAAAAGAHAVTAYPAVVAEVPIMPELIKTIRPECAQVTVK
jgi:hypothetical protein